ncbi:hypothetical protein GCM10012288_23360 [Malaciobacter pacificus]|uniref:Uncharacterized protein n=1 Tax=Malaciobacter pacificus TaxID=1080223 RepID=A0A5C2HBZ4_9BACT|nr:hypothetical protein [Malaciobacter pacificus]QEP35055.1 hypothetical protein APAC_1983 [Malaciobacter pacificus]GGD48472.1 hypothetical protein GCM10012288_23360 [Malaciobacter pacificus]
MYELVFMVFTVSTFSIPILVYLITKDLNKIDKRNKSQEILFELNLIDSLNKKR